MSDDKPLHKKTKEDLEKIEECKKRISHYEKIIKEIKNSCEHLDTEVYVEVEDLHYMKVYKQCVVCKTLFYTATNEEKIQALKEHYDDIEISYTEEELQERAKKC